jgi:diguanylate cyclase (GGDEF)-like protein
MNHEHSSRESAERHALRGAATVANAVGAAMLVLALLVCLLLVLLLRADRRNAVQGVEQADLALSLTLEQSLVRNFDLYDAPLRVLQDNPDIIAAMENRTLPEKQQDFQRLAIAREVAGIYVVNEKGDTTLNMFSSSPWQLNRADRDYFKVQRDDAQRGLYVSMPFRARKSGLKVIALSRRLNHPDGSFAGVVLATIDLSYFEQIFSGMKTGRLSHLNLFRDDGVLLANYPDQRMQDGAWTGPTPNFIRMRQSRSGSFEAPASLDRTPRIYSFRHIGNLPLVFVSVHDLSDVLSGWRARATIVGVAGAVLAGLMLVLAGWLRSAMLKLAWLERLSVPHPLSDQLTHLPNGRCFEAQLALDVKQAQAAERPLTLMTIDVDHMKHYNRIYGHLAGDAVLVRLAAYCRALEGPGARQVAARWSSNRFVILMHDTDLREGCRLAWRLRHDLALARIAHKNSAYGVLTVSVGVATLAADMDGRALLAACDAALYQAKRAAA